MKYLGIDYGAKRIGVAISDEDGTIAFPRATLDNTPQSFLQILRDIEEQKVTSIVVGDTLTFGGHENPITREAEAFIERLKKASGLNVERSWEAGSSIEASRYAPESEGHNDGAAAAIILQRFLEMRGSK